MTNQDDRLLCKKAFGILKAKCFQPSIGGVHTDLIDVNVKTVSAVKTSVSSSSRSNR